MKGMTKDQRWRGKLKQYFKNIVIHIHGGGFIAMSSAHHQPYTRLFSTDCEAPVFSIDYRLAPLVKYPYNIQDCITAYVWILNFIKSVVGVVPEKVALVGDSAGAGLCYSMLYWLIENNQRKPDIFIPCYSSLDFDSYAFRKSKYLGLEDHFLHLSALKTVHDFYVPAVVDYIKDYYLSPLKAPKELLSKMPPVRMLTCMLDPLRDQQLQMAARLHEMGHNIELNCFKGM